MSCHINPRAGISELAKHCKLRQRCADYLGSVKHPASSVIPALSAGAPHSQDTHAGSRPAHAPHRRVAASAMIYFRRTYLCNNFCRMDPRLVYVACLYLACKAEESLLAAKHLAMCAKSLRPKWTYDVKDLLDMEMVRHALPVTSLPVLPTSIPSKPNAHAHQRSRVPRCAPPSPPLSTARP